jgi:hypothetical protein
MHSCNRESETVVPRGTSNYDCQVEQTLHKLGQTPLVGLDQEDKVEIY